MSEEWLHRLRPSIRMGTDSQGGSRVWCSRSGLGIVSRVECTSPEVKTNI